MFDKLFIVKERQCPGTSFLLFDCHGFAGPCIYASVDISGGPSSAQSNTGMIGCNVIIIIVDFFWVF